MAHICLALGSNVGKSREYIDKAVELLGRSVDSINLAPLYISKAVGYTDQPDFLNTALCGETALSPQELLTFVKDAEKQVGRIYRFRWGPREIDIDIIFYDDTVLDTVELTIPHPRFAERDFVLQPLADIVPDLRDPRSGQPISALLAALPQDSLSIQTNKPTS